MVDTTPYYRTGLRDRHHYSLRRCLGGHEQRRHVNELGQRHARVVVGAELAQEPLHGDCVHGQQAPLEQVADPHGGHEPRLLLVLEGEDVSQDGQLILREGPHHVLGRVRPQLAQLGDALGE